MYGIFTNIYHKNQPNVGKYTIHGRFGLENHQIPVYHPHCDLQLMEVYLDHHFESWSLHLPKPSFFNSVSYL